jgi:hypothetical protein
VRILSWYPLAGVTAVAVVLGALVLHQILFVLIVFTVAFFGLDQLGRLMRRR